MRVVFMGTPEFAAESLRMLLAEGFDVAAVFTQPDKPVGRKQVLTAPPVKTLALAQGLPVMQPEALKDSQVWRQLRDLRPDVIAVVAYGKLLPAQVLEIPPLGCVNVHGSLLPRYRGAAPIQWSVINGEAETGITTMLMNEGLDTGDILMQCQTAVGREETAPQLYDRLAVMGAECLVGTLCRLEAGTLVPHPQQESLATYAPPLSKAEAWLDFTKTAAEVCNQVRGMCGWPVARTKLEGKMLKVYGAGVAAGAPAGVPGQVLPGPGFVVSCGEGAISLYDIQLEGGKRMPVAAFLAGRPALPGMALG